MLCKLIDNNVNYFNTLYNYVVATTKLRENFVTPMVGLRVAAITMWIMFDKWKSDHFAKCTLKIMFFGEVGGYNELL